MSLRLSLQEIVSHKSPILLSPNRYSSLHEGTTVSSIPHFDPILGPNRRISEEFNRDK